MTYTYAPKGVCSVKITLNINDDDVIESVSFIGGCNGNLQGVSRLVAGRRVDDVINTLSGIKCGMKSTSCPDQLAQALRKYKADKGE